MSFPEPHPPVCLLQGLMGTFFILDEGSLSSSIVYLCFMYMNVLPVYMSMFYHACVSSWMCLVPTVVGKALDPTELELWMAVSHQVDAGNQT